MKRRTFILSLAGSAAAGVTGWKLASAGALELPSAGARRVTRSAHALGAEVRLTVYHPVAAEADAAIDRALAELDRIESVMSLYRPDSQVSRLNATGRLADPDPALVEVLERARDLSARTDGAFDVTIQPLWKLYHEASQEGTVPSAAAIAATRERVDWRQVEISPEVVRLRRRGAAVTLNGIAQGYAADVVKRVLEEAGMRCALIDTGEIGTLGRHRRKDRWSIGIKHPRAPGELLGVAALRGRSLATSGDYETTFDADFRHHHLLDARTGDSPPELASVSVAAPTALEADALSTAVFILGREAGRRLIESTPGADALFVGKDGGREQTAGFHFIA